MKKLQQKHGSLLDVISLFQLPIKKIQNKCQKHCKGGNNV